MANSQIALSGTALEQALITPVKWTKFEALKFLYQNLLGLLANQEGTFTDQAGNEYTINDVLNISNTFPSFPTSFTDLIDLSTAFNQVLTTNIGGVTTNLQTILNNIINNNIQNSSVVNNFTEAGGRLGISLCDFLNNDASFFFSDTAFIRMKEEDISIVVGPTPPNFHKRIITIDMSKATSSECRTKKLELQFATLGEVSIAPHAKLWGALCDLDLPPTTSQTQVLPLGVSGIHGGYFGLVDFLKLTTPASFDLGNHCPAGWVSTATSPDNLLICKKEQERTLCGWAGHQRAQYGGFGVGDASSFFGCTDTALMCFVAPGPSLLHGKTLIENGTCFGTTYLPQTYKNVFRYWWDIARCIVKNDIVCHC